MADTPQQPESSPALDRDLYCLTCGYNLRGLSGDPLRCPECGKLNPLGDVEIPAEIISRQLRRMETAPALCVLTVLFAVPLHAVFWYGLWTSALFGFRGADELLWFGVFAAFFSLVWFNRAASFRSSCLGKFGWKAALAKYHFYGLLLSGLICGLIIAGAWVTWCLADRHFQGELFALVFVGGTALLCLAIILTVRRTLRGLHRRLTETLHVLQREVAVTIAREESRKRMAREHRGMFG